MIWPQDADGWPLREHSRIIPCRPHKWHVQIAGKGPTLMLLHGAGGASQSWRGLFPLLAETHQVIAVDLPGQGFTIASRGRYTLDQMAEDLGALATQEGWRPRALIGHSAGAAIALRMAELSGSVPPPQVIGINAALAGFDGLAGVMFPLMAKMMALNPLSAVFVSAGVTEQRIRRLLSGTGSEISPEGVQLYRRLASDRAHVDGTLRMMAAWDLAALLDRMPDHPSKVTLLVGSNDGTVPPRVSRDAAQRLRTASLVELPGLGHLAHEEAPAQVHQQILRTLE